jgi:signal transduction histidine kinase
VQLLWRSRPNDIDIQSLLIVPLQYADTFQGILYLGYKHRVQFDKKDELLLRAFVDATSNALNRIHNMHKLRHNIDARKKEISLLYDLSIYSTEPLTLEMLLDKSLRRIMKAVPCDTGLIYCLGEKEIWQEVASCWPSTGIPRAVKTFLLEERHLANRVNHRGSFQIVDLPKHEFTCITVGIRSKAVCKRFLRLFGDPLQLHNPEVIHRIVSSARQLGLAVDSVLDREMAEAAIVLEERQRLARNLHDSITQSLYALALSGDVANKAFDRKDENRLRTALDDITSASLQALKEMRLMLFELRPAALEEAGLIEALEFRLNTVERRSGMEVVLECQGNLRIPETMEADLYHIISEALNNSLRHSSARRVRVSLRATTIMLAIEIEDNGHGFNMACVPKGGMGLGSMNERVQKLGGNLTITSEAGKGTRVSLRVRIKGGF